MNSNTTAKLSTRKLALLFTVAFVAVALIVGAVVGAVQYAKGADQPVHHITAELTVGADKVYDDYNAETIKNALKVTAYTSETDTEGDELTANDYSVTFANGKLNSAATDNAITVTYNGTGGASCTLNIETVTKATITARVIVPDYTLISGFYVDGEGYDAFVQGMTADEVLSRLAVELVSNNPHNTEPVVKKGDDIAWNGKAPSFGTAEGTVSMPVKVSLTAGEYSAEATINFNTLHDYALVLVGDFVQPAGLTSISTVSNLASSLQGKVYIKQNNGEIKGNPITTSSQLPQNMIIGITAEALLKNEDGYKYATTMEIPYTDDDNVKPLKLVLTDISYVIPRSESIDIDGQMPIQYARDELKIGDELFIQVSYRSPILGNITTKVKLSELLSIDGQEITNIKYYVDGNETSGLSRTVNSVSFNCGKYEYFGALQVNPKAVDRPVIADEEIEFDDDCATTITGLVTTDPQNKGDIMSLTVSGGTEGVDLTIDRESGRITFNRAGEFKFKVTFAKGDESDFGWNTNVGGGTLTDNNTAVEYTVTVTNAPVVVSLTFGNGQPLQYGDSEPSYTVKGVVKDSSKMSFDSLPTGNRVMSADWGANPQAGRTNNPLYRLVYGGKQIVVGADGKETEQDYTSKYSFPTKRGTYTVYVETAATTWLQAGKSETIEFEIGKRELALDNLQITPVSYSRTPYAIENIVTDSTVKVDGLQNGDTVTSVMEYKFDNTVTSNPVHAGEYGINFTIKNPNYKWTGSDSATQTAQFKINALVLTFTVTSVNGFTYGDASANPDPKYALTVDGKPVVNEADFFAVINEPKYYLIKDGNRTEQSTSVPFSQWAAGEYEVEFTTSLNTAKGDLTGDYNTPTHKMSFTVARKSISEVKFDLTNHYTDYTGSGIDFEIVNADGGKLSNDSLVNSQTYADILTVTKTSALLADGTTAVSDNRITIPAKTAFNDGKVTVIDAGSYWFKIALNSNYTWGGQQNVDGEETVNLSFDVAQATITINWAENSSAEAKDWTANAINYTFDNSAQYPVLSASQSDLELEYAFYSDSEFNNEITDLSKIADVGTYYVRVNSFTGDALPNADYTVAVNYCLPDKVTNSFVIVSLAMDKPNLVGSGVSGDSVTVVYSGKAVDFTKFISDYETKYILGNVHMLDITFDGSKDAPATVLGDEQAYTVTVKPAGNFKWETYDVSDTEEKEFTLKITRLPIEIDWSGATLTGVYNGSKQVVSGYKLNTVDADVDVVFTYTNSSGSEVDAINADTYTVTATSIKETDSSNNYQIVAGTSSLTTEFTISKYSLAVPTMVGNTTVEFGTKYKEFTLQDNSEIKGFVWGDVVGVSVTGQWKFGSETYGTHDGSTYSFAFANKGLTFTHAGEYTVTFSLKDENNYQWKDGSDGLLTQTLIVNRKQVEAPSMESVVDGNRTTQRTIEYKTDGSGNAITQSPTNLEADGLPLSFMYGVGNAMVGGVITDTLFTTAQSANYGLYFIKVSIDGINVDYRDYEWTKTTDTIGMTNIENAGAAWGHIVYSETENSVYLHYMITKGILYVDYETPNYNFGDNGYSGTIAHQQGLLSGINLNGKTDGFAIIQGRDYTTVRDNGGTESIVFYKFASEDLAKFKPDNDNAIYDDANLVNGLPWEAGWYGIAVRIDFPEGSQFEPITGWYYFEVKKCEIVLQWNGDLTVTYNGQKQGLTATAINEIYKTETEKVKLPTLVVGLDANGTLPVNASENPYTLNAYLNAKVNGIDNDNYANFVLPSDVSKEFTIEKRNVILDVKQGDYNSIYGGDLNYSNVDWTYSTENADNQFVESNTSTFITYQLYVIADNDGLGSPVTPSTPNAAMYWIVPVLTETAQGNYTLTYEFNSAKYEVQKRKIEVTLNTDNATSVYGEQIDLYKNGVYSVDWINQIAGQDWLFNTTDVTSVFTLTAKDASNAAISATTDVGSYAVILTQVDNTNYTITQTLGDWVITNAAIDDADVQVTAVTPVTVYDGLAHSILDELVNATVTLTNNGLNKGSVKWYYLIADGLDKAPSADDSAWTELTNLTQTNAINQSYYFKVTADNHNAKVVETPCNVVIEKATVKVQVNFTIIYGEQSPVNVGTKPFKTDLKDLFGSMYTLSGIVEADKGNLSVDGLGIDGEYSYTTNYNQCDLANGNYYLRFVNGVNADGTDKLTSTNYKFVANDVVGKLTVQKLVLNVAIDNQEAFYGTKADNMPALTYVVTLSQNNSYTNLPLTLDDISVSESDFENIFTLSTDAYNADDTIKDVTADGYTITGTVIDTTNNFDVKFTDGKFTVKQAANGISDFAFANGSQYDKTTVWYGKDAWIYGVFDAQGDQEVTSEPAAEFGTLVINLYKGNSIINTANYSTVAELLAQVDAVKLGAGEYKLELTVEGNANFTDANKDWYFTVGKKDLTVTAREDSVTYGEKGPEFYAYDVSGAVNDDDIDSLLKAVNNGKLPAFFTSEYVVGTDGGKYDITVIQDVNLPTLDNYVIKLQNVLGREDGLTVNRRVVTITIHNQQNTYNLQNGETASVLTFSIVEGSFYNVTVPDKGIYNNTNQNIVVLKTIALDGKDGIETNKVLIASRNGNSVTLGAYPIYAVYFDGTASTNYDIKFSNCEYKGEIPSDMLQNENDEVITSSENHAGKFTVSQASLSIEGLGVWHLDDSNNEVKGNIYSGAANYYKAQVKDDDKLTVEFTYQKQLPNGTWSDLKENEAVVDFGSYKAIARCTDDNYTAGELTFPFEINKARLVLKARDTFIQYGTALNCNASEIKYPLEVYGNNYADGKLYDESVRFGGFAYDVIFDEQITGSNALLLSTIEQYLKDHHVSYMSNSYGVNVGVGSQCFITPVCESTTNVEVNVTTGKLEVLKRDVVVTLIGFENGNMFAQCDYLGRYDLTQAALNLAYAGDAMHEHHMSAFMSVDDMGASRDGLDALKITFSLPINAINVGSYGMTVRSSDDSNYSVKFKTGSRDGLESVSAEEADAPRFAINKAKLTIYANAVVNNGVPQSYSVIYGNSLVYGNGGITYSVAGMQNSESFEGLVKQAYEAQGKQFVRPEYTVKNGNKVFAPWESKVGETYTVSVVPFDDITLQNYELAADKSTYVSAALTLSKRLIGVTTENQEFSWDGTDYHNGVYGKEHHAVLTYIDGLLPNDPAVKNNINVTYKPVVTVKYNTNALGSYQTAGNAPKVVGNYEVTVTLNDNNYIFASGISTKLPFEVTQRVISQSDLSWKPSSILVDGTDNKGSSVIENYIDSIMEVVLFTFTANGQTGSTVINQGNASTLNTYFFDGQKLAINADGRGKYEVRIQLRNSATHNYVFDSENDTLIVSSFVITSSSISITLSIEDWIYNQTPKSPNVLINGENNDGVRLDYAAVTDISNIADFYGKGQLSGIDGLSIGSLTNANAITFNAGYYVVRAYYMGTVTNESGEEEQASVTAYYVFKIDTAKVGAPTADTMGHRFNGTEQSLTVNYDMLLLRASYNGHTGTNSNGIVVYATDVGTYKVTFTLVNSDNYEWADGVETVNGVYTLEWTIAIDDSQNKDSNVLTVPEVSPKVSYGSVSIAKESVKTGYNGQLSISWTADENPDETTVWNKGLPQNVGEYTVRLVLSDGNVNFTDKVAYTQLSVNPLEVEVTASGSFTYGNDWKTGVHYEGKGLYDHVVKGTATFELAQNYTSLQVGELYYVTVAHDGNGVAVGLTMVDGSGNDVSQNYTLKAVAGRLTVNKRPITVTLGNLSTQYGIYVNPQGTVTVTYGNGQLIKDDNLDLTITTNATAASVVGGYIINAAANNVNYQVTVVPGTYTVTARRVTIDVVEGGGVYSETIKEVGYTNVKGDNGEDLADFVAGKLTLTVVYNGVANDGTVYSNSTTVPTHAGNYTATVRGSNNVNFIVVGEPFVQFVVSKKEVDGSLITIANQTYINQTLIPQINDSLFVEQYSDLLEMYPDGIYKVLDYGNFVNAGAHTVTLQIKDFKNIKWKSVEIAERDLIFNIDKADNDLVGDITINGWVYGGYSVDNNLPTATVKFGQSQITFLYSNAINGTYNSGAPENGDVGDYYVRVSVPETENFKAYLSEPVKFAITKKALVKPTLTIITDGEGKNDVYTGFALTSAIVGYDMTLMNLSYDDINLSDGQIIARATNAGTYTVKVSIANTKNYCWQGAEGDEITLTWTIAPKAIAKPKANTDTFMVNGSVLTYIPQGFDEETMTISGNQTAYGGEFTVTIGLKDKLNYVWIEGGTDDFDLIWNVVGINTVFIIVVSTLGGESAVALIAIGVQFLLDRRKKRLADEAIDRRSQADEQSNKKTDDNGKGGND